MSDDIIEVAGVRISRRAASTTPVEQVIAGIEAHAKRELDAGERNAVEEHLKPRKPTATENADSSSEHAAGSESAVPSARPTPVVIDDLPAAPVPASSEPVSPRDLRRARTAVINHIYERPGASERLRKLAVSLRLRPDVMASALSGVFAALDELVPSGASESPTPVTDAVYRAFTEGHSS